jgi:hypothetical protein
VELTRLRGIVGDLLTSRPYRLSEPVGGDFLDVAAALHADDLAGAVTAYRGPLLPGSEAPGVVAHRQWLDTQIRSAVLASSDPNLIRAWADRAGFDDLQVWERLGTVAPARSAHRVIAATRIRELCTDYGLTGDATFM